MKKRVAVLTQTIKKKPQKEGVVEKDVGGLLQLPQQLYQNQVSNTGYKNFFLSALQFEALKKILHSTSHKGRFNLSRVLSYPVR